MDVMCAAEAYGALRDLGVEVQYVKILEDGNVVSAYETFGEVKNSKFNPIYDDRDDFYTRVEDEAEAPFKGQVELPSSYDHDHSGAAHEHGDGCCDH